MREDLGTATAHHIFVQDRAASGVKACIGRRTRPGRALIGKRGGAARSIGRCLSALDRALLTLDTSTLRSQGFYGKPSLSRGTVPNRESFLAIYDVWYGGIHLEVWNLECALGGWAVMQVPTS